MTKPKFALNEIVFAKLKGFAPWPAKVEFVENIQSVNKVKYSVYFYGTNQIGQCKEEDLFPYIEYRNKYGKQKKLPGFMLAITQADSAVGIHHISGTSGTDNDSHKEVSNLTHLDYLKAELEILKLDRDIKKSLNIANPQLTMCLTLLNKYSKITVNALMFKKNPKLIDTLLKLQVYRPRPIDNGDCDEGVANLIREKAWSIYGKVETIFLKERLHSPGNTFLEVFLEKLNEFQSSVKTMSEDELVRLSRDPTITK